MHPLDGSRLKVGRAKGEILRLNDAQEFFRRNSHNRIVRAEINPNTGNYIYRLIEISDPPSPDWGVYIGEIAHNLRSALDGLVWQLALLKTKTPARETQFPIFLIGETKRTRNRHGKFIHSFEGNGRGDGRNMIRSLHKKHQAMIEGLQPYKRGNSPHWESGRNGRHCSATNPLWWLHEINNSDKHRLIQVAGIKRGAGPMVEARDDATFNRIRWFNPKVLKKGAKICEAPLDVNVDDNLLPLISFADGCKVAKGIGVLFVLSRIANHVSDIVESFSREF